MRGPPRGLSTPGGCPRPLCTSRDTARAHGTGRYWGRGAPLVEKTGSRTSAHRMVSFQTLSPKQASVPFGLSSGARGPSHRMGRRTLTPCSRHPVRRVPQEGPSRWEGTPVWRASRGPGGAPGRPHNWGDLKYTRCLGLSGVLGVALHGLCSGPRDSVHSAPRTRASPYPSSCDTRPQGKEGLQAGPELGTRVQEAKRRPRVARGVRAAGSRRTAVQSLRTRPRCVLSWAEAPGGHGASGFS